MTFQNENYTSVGTKAAITITDPTKKLFVGVKCTNNDKYDIRYRVDDEGVIHTLVKNQKGRLTIADIEVPATEIKINIDTIVSGSIDLEIKEY